jgi:hypothetical protein
VQNQLRTVADAYAAARIDRDKTVSQLNELRAATQGGGLDAAIQLVDSPTSRTRRGKSPRSSSGSPERGWRAATSGRS